MVLDKNSYGYREEYDVKALYMIADMAKQYVTAEEGSRSFVDSIPDGSFSDFSCAVWEIMVGLVRYGKTLGADEKNE